MRRHVLLLCAVALVGAGVAGVGRVAWSDDGTSPDTSRAAVTTTASVDGAVMDATLTTVGAAPTTVAATTTTTTPPPTTATTPAPAPTTTTEPPAPPAPVVSSALPVPAAVPANPWAPEPEIRLGTIQIPKIGLDVTLYEGVTLTSINRGPSHWPGTAMPGEIGNVVVAGHRVTRTRPFRHVDQLVPGDLVVFTVGGVRHEYEVTGHEVVTPDAMRIVDQTPEPTATLFACHPPGSARYRYVVRLRLRGANA